jgi:hypothetical protein
MRIHNHAIDVAPCRHPCRHADCCMERGDDLPLGITAYWPDGTPYVPRSAQGGGHDSAIGNPAEQAIDPDPRHGAPTERAE